MVVVVDVLERVRQLVYVVTSHWFRSTFFVQTPVLKRDTG